ncbi:hypothetical protein ANCDUO_07537 [Ancylostoma duodenale]|uniref:Uncharacterized protein n=1 Tax=Ancylostoma duodenale TaxID=51022 RepID=A0A0C2GT71_9BILA|nr:hypothetical protein ANCDUO_07537 [Ancylostoma duodenale]
MNKCPKHMNPELHKMLRNELSADGETGRRHILRRMRSRFSRENEDCLTTYTDLNARRPSLRTDLLINRAKTSVIHQHFNFKQQSPQRVRRQEGGRCVIM